MEENQKRRLKPVIIVPLSILVFSILASGIVMLRNNIKKQSSDSVTVTDNIITPEKETDKHKESSIKKPEGVEEFIGSYGEYLPGAWNDSIVDITLNKKNDNENEPIEVANMFPGDIETKFFRLKVSYKDNVTVRFKAEVKSGYEKLAEVLKCKVVLFSKGKSVLYDGLMKDMPKSLNYTLTSIGNTTEEAYYGITVYLDTSVNNEYMNKNLKANFHWWIEEKNNLGSGKK